MNPQAIEELRNLGPKSAQWLREAGIQTIDDLRQLGAVLAYRIVKTNRPKSASLNLLWALAAGLCDKDWRELTNQQKASLRKALAELDR